MKKLLFSFFLTLSVSLSVVGQISLVGSTNYMIYKNNTSNNGELYVGGDFDTDFQILVFDGNFSLVKTINIPTGYGVIRPLLYQGQISTSVLSDNLFNSDNLLEYLCLKQIGTIGFDEIYSLNVLNELGSVIHIFPDTLSDNWGEINLSKYNNSYRISIETTKLIGGNLQRGNTKTYSLPGTLPCDQCGSLSGLVEPNTGGSLGEMKVYPNPFNNTLQVNYDFPTNQSNPRLVLTDILGRELKEIKLTSQSDNVSINTTDLPKGTIIVSLYGGQNMISKKVIKID